jgi:hypothetical protein
VVQTTRAGCPITLWPHHAHARTCHSRSGLQKSEKMTPHSLPSLSSTSPHSHVKVKHVQSRVRVSERARTTFGLYCLPVSSYQTTRVNIESYLRCSNAFTDPVLTPCSHTFCRACITRWIRDGPSSRCPTCKSRLSLSDGTLRNDLRLREVSEDAVVMRSTRG